MKVASCLLWGAIAFEALTALLAWQQAPGESSGAFGLIVGAAFTVIGAVIAYFFAKGQGWARIGALVLFLMGVLGLVAIPEMWTESRLLASLSIAQVGLTGAALAFASTSAGKGFFRPSTASDAGMRAILPVGRSAWAIAAGYLALFAVLVVPAPFALFCGIMAIRDMRRNPSKHGMGRAVFGLVMGSIGTAVMLFFIWKILRR